MFLITQFNFFTFTLKILSFKCIFILSFLYNHFLLYNLFSIICFQHLSCPSDIRHRDSNPRPPEREPPPTTTRPVLPPVKVSLLVISCLDVSPQWLCLLSRRLCSNFFSNDQSFCQFHFSCIPVYYLCMEYTFCFCVPCHVCAFSYVSTYMSSFYSVIFELFVSL